MARVFFRPGRGAPKPWYQADGGARLERDRAIVAEISRNLAFRIDESRKRVFLEGDLVLAECGIETRVAVRIDFPPDYPRTEPTAFDSKARFKNWPGKSLLDRHLFGEGQCCLWLPPKSRWSKSDPDALRTFLLEVVLFFDRQLAYDLTGNWPGPAYDHGPKGFREFIEEEFGIGADVARSLFPAIVKHQRVGRNDLCPCGSAVKYKRCHLSVVERIQKRIGTNELLWRFRRFDMSEI